MTEKTLTKHVRPAKTQISLGIHLVRCDCVHRSITLFHDRWIPLPIKLNKKISNDQEPIQSDPTSCPQNQKGNN